MDEFSKSNSWDVNFLCFWFYTFTGNIPGLDSGVALNGTMFPTDNCSKKSQFQVFWRYKI